MAEIKRAQEDFPHLLIRVASGVLPDARANYANARKILNDLAVYRKIASDNTHDILLVSNDADCKGVSSQYLEKYLSYFTTHPEKEGAVGNLQYDPEAYVRFPALHARTELVNRLDKQGFINGNVVLFGGNSALKMSTYCAIGGYPMSPKLGFQEWAGNTIRDLRKTYTTLGYAGEETLLVTDLRRGLITYLEGRKEQVAFGDIAAEEKMRSLEINTYPFFDYSDPIQVSRLRQEINDVLSEIIEVYEHGERLGKDAWFYRSNLEQMGIHYQVDGNPKDPTSHIEVTDISQFIARQKRMRELIENGETNMATVFERTTLH